MEDKMTPIDLLTEAHSYDWDEPKMMVITGGEPTLQNLAPLCRAFRDEKWYMALETNGTLLHTLPLGVVDWITVSPKEGSYPRILFGNEIKVVMDGKIDPHLFDDRDRFRFTHYFIQPLWDCGRGKMDDESLTASINFVMENPRWRLSLQTHKLIGMK